MYQGQRKRFVSVAKKGYISGLGFIDLKRMVKTAMKRINPEYLKRISEQINSSPYWSLLSMKIEDLGWGVSEVAMEVAEKHLQPMGIAHGGVLASLVDSATYWAVCPRLEKGTGLTTVEMKLNYLASVREGRLIGEGKCIKLGKTTALAEAKILDLEGRLLSYGTATMLVLKGVDVPAYRDFSPKFLSE